jgi:hypothetical protein
MAESPGLELKYYLHPQASEASTSQEEKTIIGVLSFLFGISWIAYANVQPSGSSLDCYFVLVAPICGLTYAAALFYSIGALAVIISVVFFYWRLFGDQQRTKV